MSLTRTDGGTLRMSIRALGRRVLASRETTLAAC